MNKQDFTQVLNDEAATLLAGQSFSRNLPAGITVFLHGDLGAGKTTFVRGVLQGMGYQGKVKSPTYTLVEPYQFADKIIYHFDLYRLMDDEEWEEAGFRDYFNAQSICMIEWPEKAERLLPQADIEIFLTHLTQGRQLRYQANSAKVQPFLQQLNT